MLIHAIDISHALGRVGVSPGDPSAHRQVVVFAVSALGQWALFAFAGIAIALRTRRPDLTILPVALVVAMPVFAGGALRPLVDYHQAWGQPAWLGALTDLSLAVIPGLVAAMIKPGRAWQIRRHEVLALSLVALVIAGIATPLLSLFQVPMGMTTTLVGRLVAMLAIGFGLGATRKTLLWLPLTLAFLAVDGVGFLAQRFLWTPEGRVPLSMIFGGIMGPLSAILAGSLCAPFAGHMRTRSLARSEQRASI